MIKSCGFTAPTGAGKVPATEITHRSATHAVAAGKFQELASRGAGIPSGIIIESGSGNILKNHVLGFIFCAISIIRKLVIY